MGPSSEERAGQQVCINRALPPATCDVRRATCDVQTIRSSFRLPVQERDPGQGEYQNSSDLRLRLQEGADLADCRACRKDVIYKQYILAGEMLGSLQTKRSTQVALPGSDVQSGLRCRIPETAQPFEDPNADSGPQSTAEKQGLVEASFQPALSMQWNRNDPAGLQMQPAR